jgi:hypothetical protein
MIQGIFNFFGRVFKTHNFIPLTVLFFMLQILSRLLKRILSFSPILGGVIGLLLLVFTLWFFWWLRKLLKGDEEGNEQRRQSYIKSILRFFYGVKPSPSLKSTIPMISEDAFIIYLEKNKPLLLKNIQNGAMIIGQPGSGKTASIILPILYQVVRKDWTGLVYDLKGKLGDEVMSCYDSITDKSNHKTAIKFINFSDPFKSDRVNPISPIYLNNKAEALDFVGTLLSNLMATDGSKSEDPFWFNNAKNIFTSIVWHTLTPMG